MMKAKPIAKKTNDGFSTVPGLATADGAPCGLIRIHEGAIASIVKHAVAEIDGVTRLSGNSIVNNLAEIVGSKKIQDRAVHIRLTNSTVAVEIAINVAYGVNLPTLCSEVQSKISNEIHNLTGLDVTKVNVIVREMEDPQQEQSQD